MRFKPALLLGPRILGLLSWVQKVWAWWVGCWSLLRHDSVSRACFDLVSNLPRQGLRLTIRIAGLTREASPRITGVLPVDWTYPKVLCFSFMHSNIPVTDIPPCLLKGKPEFVERPACISEDVVGQSELRAGIHSCSSYQSFVIDAQGPAVEQKQCRNASGRCLRCAGPELHAWDLRRYFHTLGRQSVILLHYAQWFIYWRLRCIVCFWCTTALLNPAMPHVFLSDSFDIESALWPSFASICAVAYVCGSGDQRMYVVRRCADHRPKGINKERPFG